MMQRMDFSVKYTPTWPRAFMPANQSVRNQVAKMKQIPVPELIENKRLLFVDDSIVRGTQLHETADSLYNADAKEVHMCSACPPIMYGCKYLSFSRSNSDKELLARKVFDKLEGDEEDKHIEEYADASTEREKCLLKRICEEFGFDSLGYQSLVGLLESIGINKERSALIAEQERNNTEVIIYDRKCSPRKYGAYYNQSACGCVYRGTGQGDPHTGR